jgi:hypothetical protein
MEFVCCAPNTPNPLCWFDIFFLISFYFTLFCLIPPLSMHGLVQGPFLGLFTLAWCSQNKSDLPTPILLVVLSCAWSFCSFNSFA